MHLATCARSRMLLERNVVLLHHLLDKHRGVGCEVLLKLNSIHPHAACLVSELHAEVD